MSRAFASTDLDPTNERSLVLFTQPQTSANETGILTLVQQQQQQNHQNPNHRKHIPQPSRRHVRGAEPPAVSVELPPVRETAGAHILHPGLKIGELLREVPGHQVCAGRSAGGRRKGVFDVAGSVIWNAATAGEGGALSLGQ